MIVVGRINTTARILYGTAEALFAKAGCAMPNTRIPAMKNNRFLIVFSLDSVPASPTYPLELERFATVVPVIWEYQVGLGGLEGLGKLP
jgi:hypothetical protein